MPEHTPAKRGPGRPKKALPSLPAEPKVFNNKTVAANAIDGMTAGGEPMTAPEIASLIVTPVAVVTTILDDLVSAGDLLLGDDQRYSIVITSVTSETSGEDVVELVQSAPEITIEGSYDDTVAGPGNLKGNVQTVRIPTSDLFSFLTNINLPPQFLAGLGALHDISGFLSFEVVEPTLDDPRPVGKVHATIYGCHTHVVQALNPNQLGYVSPVSVTLTPEP